ncbi:M1-specific T cell receptor beta chain-like isoform X1 [Trachinotus anak]|uniref:M1-specific T cell receptor beta chain-like isoform X1 n=1 Tax=Trachinotus anak TaxID=443729 RepID=UPI0039F1D395
MSAVAASHLIRIIMMAPILIIFAVSSLWLQVHCQDVTQYPDISWNYVSKSAEMNCSHNKDASHSQMYWYRQRPGETMTLIVYTRSGVQPDYGGSSQDKYSAIKENIESGALTVKNLQLEDSGVYFCANTVTYTEPAYFGPGTKLTVLEKGREVTPPTNESVKVFGPSSFECRNLKDDERKKTLLCVVSGFYPDHVSVFWQVNGKNKTKGVATDNAAQWTDSSRKFYRITSRLRVPADDWNNPKNEFTCIISFFSGTDTTHYQNSIRGVEAQTKGVMIRDNYLRITQSAKLSYGIFIIKSTIYGAFVAFVVWKLQGSTGKQKH